MMLLRLWRHLLLLMLLLLLLLLLRLLPAGAAPAVPIFNYHKAVSAVYEAIAEGF
jgi:hypothetical protein